MAERPSKRKQQAPRRTGGTDSPRLARILAHPLRVRILSIANQREISPAEFAREHDLDVKRVSHHFALLKKHEALELVRTRPVRGAVEHFYRGIRPAIFHSEDWKQFPRSVRDGAAGAALDELTSVVEQALESGTFSRHDDSHLIWDALLMDEQGREKMGRWILGFWGKVLEIQDESLARMAESGEQGVKVAFAVMGFEMAPPGKRG
jgi:DNA-binding transcriptional ArsR family regulator